MNIKVIELRADKFQEEKKLHEDRISLLESSSITDLRLREFYTFHKKQKKEGVPLSNISPRDLGMFLITSCMVFQRVEFNFYVNIEDENEDSILVMLSDNENFWFFASSFFKYLFTPNPVYSVEFGNSIATKMFNLSNNEKIDSLFFQMTIGLIFYFNNSALNLNIMDSEVEIENICKNKLNAIMSIIVEGNKSKKK